MARNIKAVETTWGAYKASQTFVSIAESKQAELFGVTDESPIIAHKEVTPFGTYVLAIEWL
jgi:hypothetical protein